MVGVIEDVAGKINALFYLLIFLIGIQLILNVVLVSGVQQNESVIHIHTSTLF